MMKFPDDIITILERRYKNNYQSWLDGLGEWPISISLSAPTESEAQRQSKIFMNWINAWKSWIRPETVTWKTTNWRNLGTQSIPTHVHLSSVADVSSLIGKIDHWEKSIYCRDSLLEKWPNLKNSIGQFLKDRGEINLADLQLLISTLDWLKDNPQSNLYPRQVPVLGINTKWIEGHVNWLIKALSSKADTATDFYELSGLKRLPQRVRIRILDPELRKLLGGLSDISAMPNEISRWNLPIKTTYIVENLQTGLAFEDIPNSIVFMGLGNGIELLQSVSWISNTKCFYWGDIDTHGFFILDRLRSYFPHINSALMDENTLLNHKVLWGEESTQHSTISLNHLTPAEQSLFNDLRTHRWKTNLRLEQELLPWAYTRQKLFDLDNAF